MGLIARDRKQLTGIAQATRRSEHFHPKGFKRMCEAAKPFRPRHGHRFGLSFLVLDPGDLRGNQRRKSSSVQMPSTPLLPAMNVEPLSAFRTRPDRTLRAFHIYLYAPPFNIHLHRLHSPRLLQPQQALIKFRVPDPSILSDPLPNPTQFPEEPSIRLCLQDLTRS
jgi:hypothetical protein